MRHKSLAAGLIVFLVLGLASTPEVASAYGYKALFHAAEEAVRGTAAGHQSFEVPAKGRLEVAFSPDEGGEQLVVKTINSATKELLVLSYSFTSAPVTAALVQAVHRGVTVRVVADYKNNVTAHSDKARAALSTLRTAGADVRTIRVYPIHHDKVVIADRQTVELGSFNYSAAAAHQNSENVLVNWDNPELAAVYVKHFERNYRQSEAYLAQY